MKATLFMNKKADILPWGFLGTRSKNSKLNDVWMQVHCNLNKSWVNWLLESISSTHITVSPQPSQYHLIISANRTLVPNTTNHIIIFELSQLGRKLLSGLQWVLRCNGFLRSVLHLLSQIKHSASLTLQIKL